MKIENRREFKKREDLRRLESLKNSQAVREKMMVGDSKLNESCNRGSQKRKEGKKEITEGGRIQEKVEECVPYRRIFGLRILKSD